MRNAAVVLGLAVLAGAPSGRAQPGRAIATRIVVPTPSAAPSLDDEPSPDPEPTEPSPDAEAPVADATEAPGEDAPPRVDLFARVPPRWAPGAADEWPLTPDRWRARMPRECQSRGGYRDHCQGERRVPTPIGASAELVERLALGHRATALVLKLRGAYDEWLAEVEDADPEPRLLHPVPDGRYGRGFGRTRTGAMRSRRHDGVDIGAPAGSLIRAARGGLVVYSDNLLIGFGNAVMILHADDSTTFYAHCEKTVVAAGDRVERGEPVGQVGMTGFARAPHLHFELREHGRPRDPVPRTLPREPTP